MMAEVMRKGTPKCIARHVTESPSDISPSVTPATARSFDRPIEAVWASTDSESRKHSSALALMTVRRTSSVTTRG